MTLVSVCGTVCVDIMADGAVDVISPDDVLEESPVEHSMPEHNLTWDVCVEIISEAEVIALVFFEETELAHCPLEHDSIEIIFVNGV